MGIFFRLTNLDRQVYWIDEVATSRRISGYTETVVEKQIFDGRLIGIDRLQKYQYPSTEKSISDTIETLIEEDSQHPPFYFGALTIWVKFFGNSVAVIRSFSAIISLTLVQAGWIGNQIFCL